MVKRPYPPGKKGKRRRSPLSEYGKELREKQKLRNLYGLGERQFKKYVRGILGKRRKVADVSASLIKILESRLDNIVFRLGFATSRGQAKQMVSHGYFLVNGKSLDIPSYQAKKGDVITLKSTKAQKAIFKNLKNMIKKHKTPVWLELDAQKLEGKIIGQPSLEEVAPPVEITAIFEFYSR